MNNSKIERINELARKSRNEGLTEEETQEQKNLREEYIAGFRNNLRSQLENVILVDEDGTKTPIQKKEPTTKKPNDISH